ncbi:ComEC/Rec2 family competence protein [Ligilactobacillus salivarius]|uniref:ComEC/Rec2 family competence protein n=1 Tax=Ligilactobacillus salivarius TaxID=1624 RepID=UPI001F4D19B5|nr:ComEC/Rec2 family competence protein [Ligilactobacillus salivarius]
MSPPTNENEFDYKKFCQSKKIYNGLTVKHISLENNKVPSKYKLLCKLHDLRKSIICYLQLFPKYLRGYSTALVVGYRDDGFDDINSSIKELGLLYLFSLSGMHFSENSAKISTNTTDNSRDGRYVVNYLSPHIHDFSRFFIKYYTCSIYGMDTYI